MVATTQNTKVRWGRARHARGLAPAVLAILLALTLALLAGLALSGPAAGEPVLVQNPSFEDWSGGQPLHWTCTHPRGTAETVTWSMGDWVRSGYGSLGMVIRTADANQELNVTQQIPNPVAGATYTFSAYYVSDRRLDAIKMDILFASAKIESWPEVYATSYPPKAGSPWTKITLVATAPPGTKYMFLAFRLYGGMGGTPSTAGGGCVVFDDVTLDATTDRTPPTTAVSGLPSGPTRLPVVLQFTATDNAGGSGMTGGSAKTEYNLDGKGWVTGTSLTVPAPVDGSNDGSHAVFYRSVDAAGNVETARSATFDIDTVAPTTTAWRASGRKGASIALKFCVNHASSTTAGGIRVVVFNKRGSSVQVFTVGTRSTNVVYSVKWKPRARGAYTYCVYVDADDAGNRQSAVGTAKVLVK